MRLLPLAILAAGCLVSAIDARAQTITTPVTPAPGADRTMCIHGDAVGHLTFDASSPSTCAGTHTDLPGFTFLGVVPATQTVGVFGTGITMGTGATLSVGGATTTNGITNTGDVGTGTLSTTGLATLNSVGVTNNATVGGTLGVTGATTLSTLSTSGAATLNSVGVTNNATVGGTLGVTGATTLSTLSTSGAATLDSVAVTNNATIGGTLGVTGQANLNGGANVSNNLTVAPATTVNMGGNRVQNVGAPVAESDAATKGYVDQSLSVTTAQISQAFKKIDENTEGIAVAIAMGGLVLPDTKAFALSANVGFYDGKQAIAAQAAIRSVRRLP